MKLNSSYGTGMNTLFWKRIVTSPHRIHERGIKPIGLSASMHFAKRLEPNRFCWVLSSPGVMVVRLGEFRSGQHRILLTTRNFDGKVVPLAWGKIEANRCKGGLFWDVGSRMRVTDGNQLNLLLVDLDRWHEQVTGVGWSFWDRIGDGDWIPDGIDDPDQLDLN